MYAKTPIPLDGDIPPRFKIFGQNDTNRSRNGKSTVEAQWKRLGRSRSVSEFQILERKQKRNESVAPSPRS